MVQRLPGDYRIDPTDPRAPSQEIWDRMTPEERARVLATLPSELMLTPPEGDPHRKAKNDLLDTLEAYYRRIKRTIYLSSELAVYYPGERVFAPDLIAVLDVEPHERSSWVVSEEGKGIDLAIEVTWSGDAAKDSVRNVEWFARLGIGEYFVFDRRRLTLRGFRLPAAEAGRRARIYQPIVPQAGRYASEVLGLDLAIESSRLRFFAGTAALEDPGELIARLGSMLDEVLAHKEAEARRVEELEQALAEARAEIERLRRGGQH